MDLASLTALGLMRLYPDLLKYSSGRYAFIFMGGFWLPKLFLLRVIADIAVSGLFLGSYFVRDFTDCSSIYFLFLLWPTYLPLYSRPSGILMSCLTKSYMLLVGLTSLNLGILLVLELDLK